MPLCVDRFLPTAYRRLSLLLATSALSLFLSVSAHATDYYVATNGNDSNPGTIDKPWRTMKKALWTVSGGETVYFRAGTYTPVDYSTTRPDFHPPAGQWITFKPYNGEKVIINGTWEFRGISYFIIDGFEITDLGYNYGLANNPCDIHTAACQAIAQNIPQGYGILIHPTYFKNAKTDTHHMIIRNNNIHHNSSTGISCSGGSNPIYPDSIGAHDIEVSNNHIHHNGYPKVVTGYGVYVEGVRWTIRGNVFEYNSGNNVRAGNTSPNNHATDWVIENNIARGSWSPFWHRAEKRIYEFGWGMALYGMEGGIIRNNIVYGNRGTGMWVVNVNPSKATLAYNNTIYGNALNGLVLSNMSIGKNNIVYSNAKVQSAAEIQVRGTSIAESNLIGGNSLLIQTVDSGTESNNIKGVDPLFVNASGGDFGLQASSPAIDKGVTLAEVPTDFMGTQRPVGAAYDIGAFEGAGSKAGVLPAVGAGLSGGGSFPPSSPVFYSPTGEVCPSGY